MLANVKMVILGDALDILEEKDADVKAFMDKYRNEGYSERSGDVTTWYVDIYLNQSVRDVLAKMAVADGISF